MFETSIVNMVISTVNKWRLLNLFLDNKMKMNMMTHMYGFKGISILKHFWYHIVCNKLMSIDIIYMDLNTVGNLNLPYQQSTHSDIVQMTHMYHCIKSLTYNWDNKFNWGNPDTTLHNSYIDM